MFEVWWDFQWSLHHELTAEHDNFENCSLHDETVAHIFGPPCMYTQTVLKINIQKSICIPSAISKNVPNAIINSMEHRKIITWSLQAAEDEQMTATSGPAAAITGILTSRDNNINVNKTFMVISAQIWNDLPGDVSK